jgi:hypothetical protein
MPASHDKGTDMGALEAIRAPRLKAPDGSRTVAGTRGWPLLLIGGTVLHVGIRLWFAAHRTFPVMIPDESGYLLGARLLSGGHPATLSGRPLYQGGYSILITPAFWFSEDPTTVYRVVMAINSLIGASLLPLAYVALRRLSLRRTQAYLLATVTALLPSTLYCGQFAWADAVLPVVVLAWLLLVHSWLDSGRLRYGAMASVLVAYGYATHIRGAVIAVVYLAFLFAVAWRRWAAKRDVAVLIVVLVSGLAIGWSLNAWIRSRIYPGGVAPLGHWLTDRMTRLDGLGWTVALAVGKVWYLMVSTCGVAGVGLVVTGAIAARSTAPRAIRGTACLALAALVGIALGSSAAVPDEGTVANLAYGRYLSCLAPVFLMAGGVFALRGSRKAAVRAVIGAVGLTVVSAGIIRWHAGDRLSHNFFLASDFPEICFLTRDWHSLRLWFATGTALSLLILSALVIAQGRRDGMLIAGIGFVGSSLAMVSVVTNGTTRYWQGQLTSATALIGIRAQDRVAGDYRDIPWRIWVAHAFQARHGLKPINRFDRDTLPSESTLVVVPWDTVTPARRSWPAAPPNWRPVLLRDTSYGGWVAWRRAS